MSRDDTNVNYIKDADGFELRFMGVPKTVGELRKLISEHPDDTPFGFRGQPIQKLVETKYADAGPFVSFQEIIQ